MTDPSPSNFKQQRRRTTTDLGSTNRNRGLHVTGDISLISPTTSKQSSDQVYSSEHFVDILVRNGKRCVSLVIRDDLIKHAVKKDGDNRNLVDGNLIFPPSILRNFLDERVVRTVLGCKCNICEAATRGNLFDDKYLIDTLIKRDGEGPYKRILFGTLIHMGTPYATRHICSFNTRGRALSGQNETLSRELFDPLRQKGFLPSTDNPVEAFISNYGRIEHLFNNPRMEFQNVNTRYYSENLPFIRQSLLGNVNSSFGRLYSFEIHEEFCGVNIPRDLVRKELVFKEQDEEQTTRGAISRTSYRCFSGIVLATRSTMCFQGTLVIYFTSFPVVCRLQKRFQNPASMVNS